MALVSFAAIHISSSPWRSCPSPATPSPSSRGRGFATEHVVKGGWAAAGLAQDVADQLEELLVTVSGLSERSQRAGGQVASTLLLHQLVLSLFGLRKLSGNDHQAQINHEERSNLEQEEKERESEVTNFLPWIKHATETESFWYCLFLSEAIFWGRNKNWNFCSLTTPSLNQMHLDLQFDLLIGHTHSSYIHSHWAELVNKSFRLTV